MSITLSEASGSVKKALLTVDERLKINSAYGVYVHAKEQLTSMLTILDSGSMPENRDFVDIGLMAAKELEADDPELADALTTADYDFKHVNL